MRQVEQRLKVARLYWRAGFGPTPADLKRLSTAGLGVAVQEMLAPPRGPELGPGKPPTVEGKPLDPENEYGHDVLWWLDRAVRARHQLVERMTLNMHDHFATSNDQVGNTALMLAQYKTLRRHSTGRFRDLAQAMMRDGAMQLFLDLANSNKDSPNENFAREFFELFTLGVNNGYTERDIREAARALTGFTYDYDKKAFAFDPEAHDPGKKRVLGRTGAFKPDDIVNIAIDHPNHAPYLCNKLWGYFSPEPCPKDALKRMVSAYRGSGTQLRPVLQVILTHPALYSSLDRPNQVKPPLVLVAGLLRQTGRPVEGTGWLDVLNRMGQQPFYPPNVSGWEQDEAWISTSTIQARFDAGSMLVDKTVREGGVPSSQTPAQAIAAARAWAGEPWTSARTKAAMHRYAKAVVKGRTEKDQAEHYFAERQRVLRHMLISGPDAQVS